MLLERRCPDGPNLIRQVDNFSSEIRSRASDIDSSGRFPIENIELLGDAGAFGCLTSTDDDKWFTFTMLVRLLARQCASTALLFEMFSIGAWYASRCPSPEIAEWLPDVIKGRRRIAIAIADSGANPVTEVTTTSGVILKGRKNHVTGIHHASACVVEVLGRSRQIPKCFVVPCDAPGVAVSTDRWQAMGLNGQDSCPVEFHDVKVPLENTVKEKVEAFYSQGQYYNPHVMGFSALIVGVLEGLRADFFEVTGARWSDAALIQSQIGEAESEVLAAIAFLETVARQIDGRPELVGIQVPAVKSMVTRIAPVVADSYLHIGGTELYAGHNHFQMLYKDLRGLMMLGPKTRYVDRLIGRSVLMHP